MQNRCYRCPEILLGFRYTEKSDYWAFGSSLYELMAHEQLINIRKDDNYLIHDNDLINIKLLIEKLDNYREFIDLINLSSRKDYLLTKSNILKFCNKIKSTYWKLQIPTLSLKIVNLIENNLKMNPNERSLEIN